MMWLAPIACALVSTAPRPIAPDQAVSMEFRVFMVRPAGEPAPSPPLLADVPLLRTLMATHAEPVPFDPTVGVSVDGQRWTLDGSVPPAVVMLSTPRIVARAGQPATITIGSSAQYLERVSDGLFRLVNTGEFEGIEVSVVPTVDESGAVTLNPLDIRLTHVGRRDPVEGLPFDVGRPIMNTIQTSVKLRVEQPMLVPLGTIPGQAESLAVLVSAHIVR